MEATAGRRGEAGFTLVEVLVVLAILAILVSVALPRFVGLLDTAKTRSDATELNIVQTAQDVMMADTETDTVAAIAAPGTSDMTGGGFGLNPDYMRSTTTRCDYSRTADGEVTQESCPP